MPEESKSAIFPGLALCDAHVSDMLQCDQSIRRMCYFVSIVLSPCPKAVSPPAYQL